MRPYVFDGGTAFVTGAASGIGAALATALAARGSHLGLVDCNAAGLDELAKSIRMAHPSLEVRTYVADLAETSALRALAADMLTDFSELTLLINNAGVALGGAFHQVALDDFDWLMRVNFTAPVHLTSAFLQRLRQSEGSHVVNVSSVYGLIAPPGQSAYSASKFALRGFTEVLRHELPALGIGVTAVHPGGIRTNIAANARISTDVAPQDIARARAELSRLLTIDPADAAEAILAGVAQRKTRVLIGSSATVPDVLARAFPGSYWPMLQRLLRLQRVRRRRPASHQGARG